MRALLRNRHLSADGLQWIRQAYFGSGMTMMDRPTITTTMMIITATGHDGCNRNNIHRTMAVAAEALTEPKIKKKREKTETKTETKQTKKDTPKKATKRSSSKNTETIDAASVNMTEESNADQENGENGGNDNNNGNDGQSLSPWLRQLWKGPTSSDNDAEASSDINNPSSTTTASNTNRAGALTDFDNVTFDVDDDDDGLIEPPRKRSGSSGNDFDGSGYDGHGAGGSDDGDNNDRDGHDIEKDDRFSTSTTAVSTYDPKDTWPIDPNLYPHFRSSLSDVSYNHDTELLSRDTGLSICTLGTSAGGACRLRSNAATVLRAGSVSYLIDAGEGVYRQFIMSRLNYNDVRKIFITHMHADHIHGLAGLLLSLQVSRLTETNPRPIEIYGPVGIHNYIAMSLAMTCTEIRKVQIYIYELHGGTQRSMRFSGNRKIYPEFHHKGLTRKSIPQNADGTWTLVEPMEIITPELASSMGSQPKGFSVKAAEIHHIPELQCFGYTFQEPTSQPRSLNVDAARKLGVATIDSFRLLKSGFSVMNDDKSRLVHADEVCSQPLRPRKVTVLGDCCLVPPAMEALAMNSDVLIHEATLSVNETGKKAEMGGHSTAAQAAIFAERVKAQVLMLNHLPKSLNSHLKCKQWLQESESRIRGPTKVQISYDYLEILIPRNGFNFNDVEASQSIWPEERIRVNKTIERKPQSVNGKQHIPGWR